MPAFGRTLSLLPSAGVAVLSKFTCSFCLGAYTGLLSSLGVGFVATDAGLAWLTWVYWRWGSGPSPGPPGSTGTWGRSASCCWAPASCSSRDSTSHRR